MTYPISFILTMFSISMLTGNDESVPHITRGIMPDSIIKSNVTVELQRRTVTSFNTAAVHFSNDFDGARYSDVEMINDSVFQVIISPENKPVNESPWYAFKVWSSREKSIYVRLHYPYGKHRYDPKISSDGSQWKDLSRQQIMGDSTKGITLKLKISSAPLWVAGQEVIPSSSVYRWIDSLDNSSVSIKQETIGYSILNKPIVAFRIDKTPNRKVLLILSRQHPPEITGHFAMQAFIHRILSTSQRNSDFHKQFDVVVIPMINPDGVDLGHWRHNAAGVDLNRDWDKFLQPETNAIKKFLERRSAQGDSIAFCLDFHSTKKDVYYLVTDDRTSLTTHWLDAVSVAMPESNVTRSFHGVTSATSKNWIYKTFKAEAVTYEVGDDTSRKKLKEIGEVAADNLMNVLLTAIKDKRIK